MTRNRSIMPLVVLAAMWGASSGALAQAADEKPSPTPAPADDSQALDSLLDLPTRPADSPADAPKLLDRSKVDPLKLDGEQAPRPSATSLFERAAEAMSEAGTRLADAHDPGINTQRIQKQALDRLDQLLSELRRQQQQSQQQQQQQQRQQDAGTQQNAQQQQQQQQPGQQSNQPAQDAGRRGAPEDGQRKDEPLAELLSEWGNLPPRVRDQLLQGLEDRFSPLYKQLTEQYYRRLAEESR